MSSDFANLASRAAAFAASVGHLVRSVGRRPFTIVRIDASAETLWPSVVPEEADPPRWRLELLEARWTAGKSA
jgi:hypothetical protein